MPLYEYRCAACDHRFEAIQSYSDKPLRKCPECGGKVEKLISRSGFILKGGGWYKSDYAPSKPASASEGSSDSDASPGSDTATAPTESKPDAKPAKAEPKPGKKPKAAKG